MPRSIRFPLALRALPLIAAGLVLSACGGADKPEAAKESDPALTGALAEQIMVDPDLAAGSRRDAAVTGPASGDLPPEQRSPEAIAAARAEAARLAGGTIQPVPAPANAAGGGAPAEDAATVVARAMPGGAGASCADKAEYAMAWAGKLPAALPVYPRGHVQEAAGTDAPGCRLRVVNFLTPVPVDDVLGYYYTRSRSAGYVAAHRTEGGDHVLTGDRAGAAFVLYVRKLENGLTEVDLVANGG